MDAGLNRRHMMQASAMTVVAIGSGPTNVNLTSRATPIEPKPIALHLRLSETEIASGLRRLASTIQQVDFVATVDRGSYKSLQVLHGKTRPPRVESLATDITIFGDVTVPRKLSLSPSRFNWCGSCLIGNLAIGLYVSGISNLVIFANRAEPGAPPSVLRFQPIDL